MEAGLHVTWQDKRSPHLLKKGFGHFAKEKEKREAAIFLKRVREPSEKRKKSEKEKGRKEEFEGCNVKIFLWFI